MQDKFIPAPRADRSTDPFVAHTFLWVPATSAVEAAGQSLQGSFNTQIFRRAFSMGAQEQLLREAIMKQKAGKAEGRES